MHNGSFMYFNIFSFCSRRYPETFNTSNSLVASSWIVISNLCSRLFNGKWESFKEFFFNYLVKDVVFYSAINTECQVLEKPCGKCSVFRKVVDWQGCDFLRIEFVCSCFRFVFWSHTLNSQSEVQLFCKAFVPDHVLMASIEIFRIFWFMYLNFAHCLTNFAD